MKTSRIRAFVAAALVGALASTMAHAQDPAGKPGGQPPPTNFDRTVLPIAEPSSPLYTELDVRKAKAPPRFEVKAPKNAPNVLVVLLDDMGFANPDTFGGAIHMPTLERLAQGGLRYNQFHTVALCSPTRAALLSGRNHHMNNFGAVAEMGTSFPGQTGDSSQQYRADG